MAYAHTQETSRNKNYETRQSTLTPAETIRATLLNRISWGAVFSGLTMAFATQLTLSLIGLGIGIATLEPNSTAVTTTENASATLSIGAAAWWIVSGIIAAGVGGLTAGRLAGEPKKSTAGWHGLISWAASILFLTLLMTTAAGALTSGPLQMIVNNNAYEAGTINSDVGSVANPNATGNYAAIPSDGTQRATIDPEIVSTASLVSAIALILGAIAAWFAGCAGAVNTRSADRSDRYQEDVVH